MTTQQIAAMRQAHEALRRAHVRLTVLMRNHSEKVQVEALGELDAAMEALDAAGVAACARCDGEGYRSATQVCRTCDGSGLVPDGEIASAFGNAPIKCVKDCPTCKPTPGVALPDGGRR
jgi:hypothetical protein